MESKAGAGAVAPSVTGGGDHVPGDEGTSGPMFAGSPGRPCRAKGLHGIGVSRVAACLAVCEGPIARSVSALIWTVPQRADGCTREQAR